MKGPSTYYIVRTTIENPNSLNLYSPTQTKDNSFQIAPPNDPLHQTTNIPTQTAPPHFLTSYPIPPTSSTTARQMK